MSTQSEIKQGLPVTAGKVISWFFGSLVFLIGLINTFWGNDFWFGIFLILLSFVYFLPFQEIVKKLTGITVPFPAVIRIVLGIFILMAALGVGELFDKVDMMRADFR